ncbi:MAG: CoA pyrophosphatase [Chloroflexi bacterium]|nr:CoA pyrophosphatase [Chloroflexota bacterium]
MNTPLTPDDVRRALRGPRPGLAAQMRMAPRPRPGGYIPAPDRPPKQGGVLLLVYPCDGELCLVLTRRTETVANHKGQISFPGGAQEEGETLQQAALREASEELAVPPATLEVLGALTPLYIPPSNYCITPTVALAAARPAFHADPTEVVEVLEVPLRLLLDSQTTGEEEWEVRGIPARVPFYRLGPHKVWGATAMVLAELLAMLAQVQDQAAQT